MGKRQSGIESAPLLSSGAAIVEQNELFAGVATARWSIDRNSVAYEKADSHTLSLYLSGGDTSYRADHRGRYGSAGKLCMMPAHHRSRWHIGGAIDFVHLYFTDAALKHHAVSHYDCDAREVELIDLTYGDDASLRTLMTGFLAAYGDGPDGTLLAEQRFHGLLDHLVRHYKAFTLRETPLSAGLSPHHRARMKAAIEDGLEDKLSLQGLADTVGLSPFHFARMFKLSFGETPAAYILRRRIERVKALLGTGAPLAAISSLTGFAQQSHMTSHFKRLTGVTPAHYRKAVA